jgi:hypothetical protein
VGEVDQFWWNRSKKKTVEAIQGGEVDQFMHRVVSPCFADDAHFFWSSLKE